MNYKQTNLFGGEDEVSEPMTEEQLHRKILKELGFRDTLDKLIEEMQGLFEAIEFMKENGTAAVIEEAVDVSIVLKRVFIHFGEDICKEVREYKLKRTEQRLKEGEL